THAFGDDVRFLLGILEALFVHAFVVSDEFQEIRNIVGAALVANSLDPGMLFVVHVLGIVGGVVEQDLHAISSSIFQSLCRPMIQQVSETSGPSLVITSLFICEQQ